MEQITLKANINECIVENWQSNTGEVNARVMNVELCDRLSGCGNQFVTFELADGTVYESLVKDGKAKIPSIEEPQFIKIGAYAEDINGDKCEKRYSAHPCNVYVNMGGYKVGAGEPPKPTPGDYAELLELIKNSGGGGSITEIAEKTYIYELESGVYKVNGIPDTEHALWLNGAMNLGLTRGVAIVSKSDAEIYEWLFVGLDSNYYTCSMKGVTVFNGESWELDTWGEIETQAYKARNFKDVDNAHYPTTQAVADYVAAALKDVGGGGADITLLDEIDMSASAKEVYNAPAINDALMEFSDILTDHDERIDAIGGGSGEWKLLIDITIPEEDASVTLFVDKDSEGNPFSCSEIDIVWEGIQATDGTKDGKAWISLNPTRAGYNIGKCGVITQNYFYYTSQANYTNGHSIRLSRGNLTQTGQNLFKTDFLKDFPNGITSIEVSGYGSKSFYGRVVIYGR